MFYKEIKNRQGQGLLILKISSLGANHDVVRSWLDIYTGLPKQSLVRHCPLQVECIDLFMKNSY